MTTQVDSLDSDIRAAMAAAKETDVSDSPQADVAVDSSPGLAETEAQEPVQSAAPGDAGEPGQSEAAKAAARARDAQGRFAAKAAAKTSAPEVGATTKAGSPTQPAPSPTSTTPPLAGGDSSTPQPKAPEYKGPAGWSPAARDALAKAPPEVQKEAAKRERDFAMEMQRAAPERRFAQEVGQAFEPLARSRGATVPQLLQSYHQADQMLSSPDQATKAEAVASIILNYGLEDFDALVNALKRGPQQAQQQRQAPQQTFDPDALAAQVEQKLEAKFIRKQADAEVDKFFADPSNEALHGEHGRRVLARMMVEIRAAAESGEGDISMADALDRATWALPETRANLQQREAATAANAQAASTQRARAAAVSVRSQPASAPTAQRDDLDSTIRAALAQAKRR